jgi:UDP-MurNAc hydroxylase
MPKIDYLGHAGFVVEYAGTRVVIDPWFYPAFLASWFPYPDNRFLADRVTGGRFDYLYVSHTHEDHFDRRLLEGVNKDVTILCPAYRTKALQKQFSALGFTRIIPLAHKQSLELAPGFTATVLLDTGHKEDSGLLLEMGGFRFLDLNDCNTPLSELPGGIDLIAAQFSGAMWYPNCYDYPPDVMRQKVSAVRDGLVKTLVSKCRATGAKAYLPSAGPPIFLDPELGEYTERGATIFPVWADVAEAFAEACPGVRVYAVEPGDRVLAGDEVAVEPFVGERPDSSLETYRARRRDEWQAFHDARVEPVAFEELATYFKKLQKRNRHLLHDFSKTLRVTADGRSWDVRLGELAEDHEIEGEEPYPADYTLEVPTRVLRAVIGGEVGWEEALLSMRVKLRRDPDVFDSRLMGLLRYGNEPAQTLYMTREMASSETIERDGLRMQRFCPHGSEDLTFATITDGVIACPRHHWRWDIRTGECIEGGNLKLRIEPVNGAASGCPGARACPAVAACGKGHTDGE